jgi:hypothetical protein
MTAMYTATLKLATGTSKKNVHNHLLQQRKRATKYKILLKQSFKAVYHSAGKCGDGCIPTRGATN